VCNSNPWPNSSPRWTTLINFSVAVLSSSRNIMNVKEGFQWIRNTANVFCSKVFCFGISPEWSKENLSQCYSSPSQESNLEFYKYELDCLSLNSRGEWQKIQVQLLGTWYSAIHKSVHLSSFRIFSFMFYTLVHGTYFQSILQIQTVRGSQAEPEQLKRQALGHTQVFIQWVPRIFLRCKATGACWPLTSVQCRG
jgi:hypothetical protein